ncbi:MAG TPA: iron-sulfur cluster assembly scaffold protein, partial [Sphingopyxis sp.]|nr:iron-sulfur cluster assembly scaffold protein [Sphingopyxis sp.]
MSAPLYNRDILALAVATADYLPLADARHRISKRAPLCGSAIILDLDTDDAGRVTRVGMHVEACALGQASAALLARHAPGLGLADI